MSPLDPTTSADLADARRHLPRAPLAALEAFARRQLRARRRLGLLLDFYGRHSCRLAQIHLLTASSVAVARFCGHSAAFDALGEAILPVEDAGTLRSAAWARYADVCTRRLPAELRDEAWLEAHAEDWLALRRAGLAEAFFAEAADHPRETVWQLMRQHVAIVFGARESAHVSEADAPAETGIARAMSRAVSRLAPTGWPLVAHYVRATVAALFSAAPERRPGVPAYPRTGWVVLRSFATAWRAWTVYRRGLRIQNRGQFAQESDWPLLETLMGDDVRHVHPLIVRFYQNPGRFRASASLELRTLPLMLYSRLAALLLGQGLYEQDQPVIEVRLRVFRRDDGSMHFVRELYCGDSLRVFDSDFVIRAVAGKPTLVEVFGDIGVDVVLDVVRHPDGGVSIVGRDIYWRGLRLPRTALHIDFTSRVVTDEAGREHVEVTGSLNFEPRTAIGRFILHTLLRRPHYLGSIRYVLWPDAPEQVSHSGAAE